MSWPGLKLRRAILPATTFAVVVTVHFLWLGLFPETDDAQEGWAVVATGQAPSWLHRYVESGGYWMSYSYALPLAFSVAALRWYLERRFRGAGKMAVGGIALSGFLAAVGCFLLGCCGSPMLSVYLSLFGARFLPLAKPLIAAVTTLMIAAAAVWMNCRTRQPGSPCVSKACCK